MKEQDIQVFIDGAKNYFTQHKTDGVEVGAPYLAALEESQAFDYTGIISITGPYQGCVYVSAPKALLNHLLLSIGETQTTHENLFDLIGEVANTISGNARSQFGAEFMISVPIVVQGKPEQIHLPKDTRVYVIPLLWKAYNASIVVGLQA
ncbi:MAG: chemotaxis protein CheX [Pseudomonadales bacterium]|nr:chemotaxis protein CheX [Pseudomonadales bacterium]